MDMLCQSRESMGFPLALLCHEQEWLHSQSDPQEAMSHESSWICWHHQNP